jgi:hypothetical protein
MWVRAAHPSQSCSWLSEDRLVQSTSFADGTRLVASFADAPRLLDDLPLPPHSVTAIIDGRAAHVFNV